MELKRVRALSILLLLLLLWQLVIVNYPRLRFANRNLSIKVL